MDDIRKLIGSLNLTVSEAMSGINRNDRGILFLEDDEGRLAGCITDGDIRRFLLAGGKMDEPAANAANNQPKAAYSFEEAKRIYHSRDYVVIPILDQNGRIEDFYDGGIITPLPRIALQIPVVINAGGKGTRLDPYTRVLPKPLIPVGDIPMIELIMNEFKSYSCDDFHIIVNYKKELMKAYFSDKDPEYHITWHDEEKPLGTGGGLSLLKGHFADTFFFSNCDSLLTANYERIIEFHKENHNVITMVCAYKNLVIPYGIVEMGLNGTIEEMKEKPMLSFLTNTGFYVVEPEVIEEMEDQVPAGFPEIMEKERQKGRKVAVFPVSENDWMDMGQVSELEKMREKLFGKK